VAFVDRVTPPDFSFVHGDGWTHGGRPLMSDDKAAFLKRVADKEYLVHDLDQVKVEMHGDVAITSGRYVSLFVPANRNAANPARLNSIWFERVYAKRNGQWQFLSHRTVHRAKRRTSWRRFDCGSTVARRRFLHFPLRVRRAHTLEPGGGHARYHFVSGTRSRSRAGVAQQPCTSDADSTVDAIYRQDPGACRPAAKATPGLSNSGTDRPLYARSSVTSRSPAKHLQRFLPANNRTQG
jgi:hypothetical protein